MTLNGLIDSAMAAMNEALGTEHIRWEGKDELTPLQNLRNYISMDAANVKLTVSGKDTFDMRVNPLEGNRLRRIGPGGERTATRTDNFKVLSQRLPLFYTDITLLRKEVEEDEAALMALQLGRHDVFFERIFKVVKSKQTESKLTILNDVEHKTGAVPNFTKQEDRTQTSVEDMTSLLAIINGWYLGLFGVTDATGVGGGGAAGTNYNTYVASAAGGGLWTTKFGINPADTFWLNRDGVNSMAPTQGTYSDVATPVGMTGFYNAMLSVISRSTYNEVPSIPGDDAGSIVKQEPTKANALWYTSHMGWRVLQSGPNISQDLWIDRTDPYVGLPMVGGIPCKEWDRMTYAAIYPGTSNTVLAAEGAGDIKGPRFILHRRDTCMPVTHRLYWFKRQTATVPSNIPDLIIKYVDLKMNWFCPIMRTQGHVAPSTSITSLGTY